jgi:hypothetical protein
MVPGSRRRAIAAVCFGLTAALTPSRALAQHEASLDVGVTSVAYDSTARTSGLTLAPALRFVHSLTTLGASGALSLFDSGGWSARGTLTGSAFTPAFHALRGEAAGVVGGSQFEDGTATAQWLAQMRVHLLGAREGAWLALGGGQSWNGLELRGTTLLGAGGWLRRRGATLAAAVLPTTTGGGRYTDATTSLTWSTSALELAGSLTARDGGDLIPGGTWGDVSATWWVSRRAALVAGWGSYAPDPAQALPGGRYVTLSVRLGTRPVRYPELHVDHRAPAGPIPRGTVHDVEVRDARGSQPVLLVRVEGATRVEVMGDFTDWQPVQLTHVSDDRWEIALSLAPGEHHFNVRVDGGEWGVSADGPSVADEFAGRVGVLLVR